MLKKTIAIACVVVLSTAFVPYQKLEGDCIDGLKSVVQKMAKLTIPKDNKAYYMHMNIVKEMSEGTKEPNTDQEVKLIISATQLHYESSVVSVYKDPKDVITVIHPLKQIVRTNGSKMPYSQEGVLGVSEAQLAMLNECTLQSCKSISQKGKSLNELILVANKSLREKAKVNTMRFVYDPLQKDLKEIETIYLKDYTMKREQLIIYNTDYNYKGTMPKSVLSKVCNSNGTLLTKYKGYKLVDQRNQ